MIFKEIEVWNWRHLDNRILKGLTPGLNLIVGPNESGKSSLFEALRFGLFESTSGSKKYQRVVRSLTLDDPPRVRVAFEIDGQSVEVTKQFLVRGDTNLKASGGVVERGKDAEAYLFNLLAMEKSKGHSENFDGAENLWKLLWIRQGDSVRSPDGDIGDSGRARLQDALASEVEGLATGEAGRALMERVQEEFKRYYTPTGKSARKGGPLQAAMDDHDAALKVSREVNAQRDRVHWLSQEIQKLEVKGKQLQATESTRRAEAESAQVRAKGVLELDGKIKEQTYQLREVASKHEQAQTQLTQRKALEEETRGAQEDLKAKAGALTALQGGFKEAEIEARGAESRLVDLRADREAAEKAADFARAQEKRQGDLKRLAELERDIERGESNLKEQVKLRGELGANKVTPASLKGLQKKRDACQRAEAKLEGASARVDIQAHTDMSFGAITLGAGESKSLRVSEPQRFEVPGVMTLSLSPGLADLPELKRAVEAAKEGLARALQDLEVGSLSEAEAALARRGDIEASLKSLSQQLSYLAPQGLDTLKSERQTLKVGIEATPDVGGEVLSLEEAETRLKEARDGFEEAQQASIALDKRLGIRRQEVAVAESKAGNARERVAGLQARLNALPDSEALQAALSEAAKEVSLHERTLAELQTRRESLGGEGAIAEAEQARKALVRYQERMDTIKSKLMEQRAELRASGADGLHSKVQEAEAHLAACLARRDREMAHGKALLVLKERLEAAQGEAQAQLSEPVIKAVQPYLRQVFPASGLKLGEGWSLEGLKGEQALESFDTLSRGAREQLSILVRLGLAEIMAGEGRLPLILDDALVNSDPERLRRMTQALYRATRKGHLQVLFFSCHTEAFDGLGEDHRIDLPGHPRR